MLIFIIKLINFIQEDLRTRLIVIDLQTSHKEKPN